MQKRLLVTVLLCALLGYKDETCAHQNELAQGKGSRESCNTHEKKCCARLPQPPTLEEPYGDILAGENCLCCLENRQMLSKKDVNHNKVCRSYEELCASLCAPLNYPAASVPPSYTPDPALPVPSCQKIIFPPMPENPLSLQGKNVLVIGGSKGIGKAVAERFTAEGCNVIATSRHPECYEKPVGYSLQKVDIRFEDEVKSYITHVVETCFKGKLDILVNCAGIYWGGPLGAATGDDLLNILNNNVAGYQRVTHYALPYMRHSNETRVISFGSTASYVISHPFGGYTISKIAIQKWNDTLQIEEMFNKALGFEQFGPTFSCIEPDTVLTSIGLYEWFQASTLSPNDPLVEGLQQTLAGIQNTDLITMPASLTAEVAFRIAVAPQPGVRYTDALEDSPFMTLELVRETNVLSQDDAINLIWSPINALYIELLPELKAILGSIYCEGCPQGSTPLRFAQLKEYVQQRLQEIAANALKNGGRCGASQSQGKS